MLSPLKNEIWNCGILPDFEVRQTYEDYCNEVNTVIKFAYEQATKENDENAKLP